MKFSERLKMQVRRCGWSGDVECLLAQQVGNDRNAYGENIVMKTYEEGQAVEPTFRMNQHDAQALIDGLWECGFRPSEGTGSAGALAATQAHLKDMRDFAQKALSAVLTANEARKAAQ